jgi:hypothetical protein
VHVPFEEQLRIDVEQETWHEEDRSKGAEPAGFRLPIRRCELERAPPRAPESRPSKAISGTTKIVAKLQAIWAATPSQRSPLMLFTNAITNDPNREKAAQPAMPLRRAQATLKPSPTPADSPSRARAAAPASATLKKTR